MTADQRSVPTTVKGGCHVGPLLKRSNTIPHCCRSSRLGGGTTNKNQFRATGNKKNPLPVIKLICVFTQAPFLIINAPGIPVCMCCLKDLNPEIAPLRHV